ncbi:hypothetical protein [Streptomyces sp. NPDC088746]
MERQTVGDALLGGPAATGRTAKAYIVHRVGMPPGAWRTTVTVE